MRKRIKKMTACILTALLGLSIMNFPVHAQETQANQQIENNSVSIQNMESLFIGQSMFKTAVQALTSLDKNAGPFNVTGDTDGWTYDDIKKTLTFSKNGNYKVTGDGKQTDVQIVVGANITITLTVENVNCHPSGAGMSINGSSTVTLMLQGENEFKSGTNNNAGIEFNNATGSLTIDGTGSVKATGGRIGAGIGGSGYATGSNINIAGGTVFAESDAGAGIGGGNGAAANNITINGGIITTTSNVGAGIGGGDGGAGSIITINGGTITTTSTIGDGIGGGWHATGSSDITITKGSVKATGAEAISVTPTDGNGKPVYLATLDIAEDVKQIKVDGKDYKIEGKHENDTNYYLYMTAGERYIETESNVYKAEWDTTINSFKDITAPIETGDLKVTGGAYGIDYIFDNTKNTLTFNTDGKYSVIGNGNKTKERIVVKEKLENMTLTLNNVKYDPGELSSELNWNNAGLSIDGTSKVTLLLEGENEFYSRGGEAAGIEFNDATTGSLTIDGTGSVTATGGYHGAGIGGGEGKSGNNIIIKGGTIFASATNYGAGIGGGYQGSGNEITIEDGMVTALSSGNSYGAGIGGGYEGAGTDITISGGTVIANGNGGGAGIGGGPSGLGTNITISDGTVIAYGNGGGAGIGGGNEGTGTNIIITGGKVTAESSDGAGIGGGGIGGIGNDITISDGTVNAKSIAGAGIGGGSGEYVNSEGNGENITISGGAVTAESNFGAGIGGGAGEIYGASSGVGKNITISGGTVTAKSTSGAGIGDGENGTRSSGITITGGSVKATKDEKESISVTPTNGNNKSVYLVKLPNQDNVNEVTVDSAATSPASFKRAGNHPENDTSFYLYLTGEDHIITANQNKYKAIWDIASSTFTVKPIPPAPVNITATQTASTITVTEPADAAIYGGVEYSMDNQNWQTSNIFENLDSSKYYIIYVKYKGNDTYIESEVAQKTVKTLPATYTITIPSTTLTAGNSGSKNEIKVSSMDIGYQDKVNVKILGNANISNDGMLTLTRQSASNTITSALLVNGVAFKDINKNIATFTKSNKDPVSISFAKPTQTNIPAGTYNGTVTFGVTYTQQGG